MKKLLPIIVFTILTSVMFSQEINLATSGAIVDCGIYPNTSCTCDQMGHLIDGNESTTVSFVPGEGRGFWIVIDLKDLYEISAIMFKSTGSQSTAMASVNGGVTVSEAWDNGSFLDDCVANTRYSLANIPLGKVRYIDFIFSNGQGPIDITDIYIYHTPNVVATTNVIASLPGQYLQLKTGNDVRMHISADNGSIGIGTIYPSPEYKLDIQGGGLNISDSRSNNSTPGLNLYTQSDILSSFRCDNAAKPATNLIEKSGLYWAWGILNNGTWAIQPDGALRGNGGFFINRAYQVGIGTSTPSTALEVAGEIKATKFIGDGSGLTGISTPSHFSSMATVIPDFGAILDGGIYNGVSAAGGVPDNSYGGWQHLLVMRHPNASNNHQFQLASSFSENDRLFFRKISGGLSPKSPAWIELATRGSNRFEGDQTIKGKITATEIEILETGDIPDYVFKPGYKLMPLHEVERFVNKNSHLPEVPSEKEFKEKGMNLVEMNATLLKKVEELTLYMIELKKENDRQNALINKLLQKQ